MGDETAEGTGVAADTRTADTGTAADTAVPEGDPTFKGSTMLYCIGVFLIGLFVFLVYTVVGALANIEISFDIPYLTRGRTTTPTTLAVVTKASVNLTANDTVDIKQVDDEIEIVQLRDDYFVPGEGDEEEVRFNYGR